MGKPDESRRAFLVGAAVGASAVAGTTMVTGALAQHRQHPKITEAPDASHGHDTGEGHGAFLNDYNAATVAAFAERLMPGAPGKLMGKRPCHHGGPGDRAGPDGCTDQERASGFIRLAHDRLLPLVLSECIAASGFESTLS